MSGARPGVELSIKLRFRHDPPTHPGRFRRRGRTGGGLVADRRWVDGRGAAVGWDVAPASRPWRGSAGADVPCGNLGMTGSADSANSTPRQVPYSWKPMGRPNRLTAGGRVVEGKLTIVWGDSPLMRLRRADFPPAFQARCTQWFEECPIESITASEVVLRAGDGKSYKLQRARRSDGGD